MWKNNLMNGLRIKQLDENGELKVKKDKCVVGSGL